MHYSYDHIKTAVSLRLKICHMKVNEIPPKDEIDLKSLLDQRFSFDDPIAVFDLLHAGKGTGKISSD